MSQIFKERILELQKLSSDELIKEFERIFSKEFTELTEELGMEYQVLYKWKKNGIPTSGTTRKYLEMLLYCKFQEETTKEELKMYRDFFDSFEKIFEFKKTLI